MALTLRIIGGMTAAGITRAFLGAESAVGQRITRAKSKMKAAHIAFRVPSAEDLQARLSCVLAVLFLIIDEGHLATSPDTEPVRPLHTCRTLAPVGPPSSGARSLRHRNRVGRQHSGGGLPDTPPPPTAVAVSGELAGVVSLGSLLA